MLRNPFKIVEWFEEEMAHYTGAPYAIATNSCTNAIFLSCKHFGIENKEITIPPISGTLFEWVFRKLGLSTKPTLLAIGEIR